MAEDTGTGGGPVVVREIYRGQPPGEVVSGAASVKSTRIRRRRPEPKAIEGWPDIYPGELRDLESSPIWRAGLDMGTKTQNQK